MNQRILIATLSLLIGIGVGYGGAHAFAKAPGRTNAYAGASGFRGSFGMGPGGMRGAGMGFLAGTVAKVDASSITLNTRDGSSHVVILSPSTTISKSVTGSVSDIAAGANVIVNGAVSPDGSVTASLVQIRPEVPAPTAQQ